MAESSTKMRVQVVEGTALVWSLADVQTLRKHRVRGVMDGSLPENTLQNKMRGLPMIILSEAATLLQEEGVIELVQFPAMLTSPTERMELLHNASENGDQARQKQKYYEERKRQINKHSNKIFLSAKKKNEKLAKDDPKRVPDDELTLERVINDRIELIPDPKPGTLLAQVHMEYPFINDLPSEPATWSFPSTRREKMLYAFYKDLWKRGDYWISPGEDSGMDYLVYKGDPSLVHATFGVIVVESGSSGSTASSNMDQASNRGLHVGYMTGVVRANTNYKRSTLIAFVREDMSVTYQTIKWKGLSFGNFTSE